MSEIVDFPQKPEVDMIADMKGPDRFGNDIFLDGHIVPNMVMHDKGETVELVLDGRMIYIFPREIAYLAAHFAANAMAIGAGHPCFSAPHKTGKPFATPITRMDG